MPPIKWSLLLLLVAVVVVVLGVISSCTASSAGLEELARSVRLAANDEGDNDKPADDAMPATTTTTTPDKNQLNSNHRQQIPATTATPDEVAPSSGGKRAQLAKRAPAPPLAATGQPIRVSETELLPFSDFNVAQPAFSDLMRSWPPTTRQFARQNELQRQQHSSKASQPYHRRPSSSRRRPPSSGPNSGSSDVESRLDGQEDSSLVLNHLNEDLDDTIVTADESFEQDQLPEPATWVNYLGDLGDFIYLQLRQFFESSSKSPLERDTNNVKTQTSKQVEPIDDLLDDFYYDQYENSQVLYYGPQLVREGDIFEIGCYLPNEQPAEWTKSGKLLYQTSEPTAEATKSSGGDKSESNYNNYNLSTILGPNGAPKIIRRGNFLGAKQNFTLKIFEAVPGDTGNYRCTRMSRKFHKLIVVPLKTTTSQLYLIQQRLLSVVSPKMASLAPSQTSSASVAYQTSKLYSSGSSLSPKRSQQQHQQQQPASIEASGQSMPASNQVASSRPVNFRPGELQTPSTLTTSSSKNYLLPSYLIVEQQPLLVNCNISDEFVLRKLSQNPQVPIAWYKNGKLMRQSGKLINSFTASAVNGSNNLQVTPNGRQGVRPISQPIASAPASPVSANQRIQFVGRNGRQMYISSAVYSDAGDYLCSWSRLPSQMPSGGGDDDDTTSVSGGSDSATGGGGTSKMLTSNPLAAGSQMQLVAPVKLRPFKSAYHVRRGHQLRLVCQVQRGYPAAQISWYIGNQLVDGDFLRQHPNEYKILQLNNNGRLGQTVTSSIETPGNSAGPKQTNREPDETPKLVEINPIPSGRQQMQLTANGRGQWIDYRELGNEKYLVETREQQLRYLQMKLGQLTGTTTPSPGEAGPAANNNQPGGQELAAMSSTTTATSGQVLLHNQATLSVLVISSLDVEKHTSRYACRATSRANTDEVTTVIRVRESKTILVRPSNGAATLVYGQDLHFECAQTDRRDAQFLWFKVGLGGGPETMLDPNADDNLKIHNERLEMLKPGRDAIGDYICRALGEENKPEEQAIIRVRQPPYIDDFGVDTSHTGRSTVVTDGERLVLLCRVSDESVPVNITWLRSTKSDDEREMVPIPETDAVSSSSSSSSSAETNNNNNNSNDPDVQTFTAPSSVVVEKVNNFTRRLIIESMGPEHRGYYACLVDNGVTERARKTIFVRVKDKFVALWPFLGIVAQLFILFTIIYVWETQRAHKSINLAPAPTPAKRPASGPTNAMENVPLNS